MKKSKYRSTTSKLGRYSQPPRPKSWVVTGRVEQPTWNNFGLKLTDQQLSQLKVEMAKTLLKHRNHRTHTNEQVTA